MDKEILALIGRLYLDTITLNNFAESLKNRVTELEAQLATAQQNLSKKTKDS